MKKIKDHYFYKARKQKYPARSVFKLQEINRKHHLLSRRTKALDLGSAPGSWLKYMARTIGPEGVVVGVDQKSLKIDLPNHCHFIQADLNELDLNIFSKYANQFDVIVSDMAPATTGIKHADAAASYHLCQLALNISKRWLKAKGTILVKSFQGSSFPKLLADMRTDYQKVKVIKPKSSRDESVEVFVLGQGKKVFHSSAET